MTAGLEFRSLALDDLSSGIYFEIARGFLAPPAVRGTDYTVAAKAGRMAGNRVADVNTILLVGIVFGDTEADFLTAIQTLYTVLDEDGVGPGSLIVRGPNLGLASGVEASIEARVKNWIPGDLQAGVMQALSIELESVDPAWVMAS